MMPSDMIEEVLRSYGITGAIVVPFGTGLINHTWKINDAFILQRINEQVFRQPEIIAANIRLIADYLQKNHPRYFFVAPVKSSDGKEMVWHGGWYRLFPYVQGAIAKEVVHTAAEAGEAAVQFGRFTNRLSHFDVSLLQPAIPHFHDLSLRYRQFKEALLQGNKARIGMCREAIHAVESNSAIVSEYASIVQEHRFPLRVIHHDTKISNVLFDASGKGICVIDLDTVMRGYFISDVGDMMRTYLSPVSEEENDFSKIEFRTDVYHAIVWGYFGEMKTELTAVEKDHFFYAGEFMIYMQAVRFLTDYISNDVYYGARYPEHNLVRAHNQLVLLNRLQENKMKLTDDR